MRLPILMVAIVTISCQHRKQADTMTLASDTQEEMDYCEGGKDRMLENARELLNGNYEAENPDVLKDPSFAPQTTSVNIAIKDSGRIQFKTPWRFPKAMINGEPSARTVSDDLGFDNTKISDTATLDCKTLFLTTNQYYRTYWSQSWKLYDSNTHIVRPLADGRIKVKSTEVRTGSGSSKPDRYHYFKHDSDQDGWRVFRKIASP